MAKTGCAEIDADPVHKMNLTLLANANARERMIRLADWLAVGVAVSLPWSTSATAILIVLWLLALLPTMDVAAIRREVESAAGGLPVLLWCIGAAGMLWADVSWVERFGGLGGFHRLLVIPLLLAQFRRSENGNWVLIGFLASATGLLLLSWALTLFPTLPWRGKGPGVPVKDYIFQSATFLICAFVLIGRACDYARVRNRRMMVLVGALAVLFLANIAFVAASRTVLVVTPVLVVFLGWRQFGWKGIFGACLLGIVAASAAWLGSSYLRDRVHNSIEELQAYRTMDAPNSTGLHAEFLRKSWMIFSAAPIVGHGTGSIPDQFRRTVGGTGAASVVSDNPHNQIFTVAIQIGLLGTVVLLAMWLAHFCLFRAGTLTAWAGTVVVVDNVVSSLFNSHLFDFSHGWLYIFGVGVAGGIALQQRHPAVETRPVAER